jgi:hypothetical protein
LCCRNPPRYATFLQRAKAGYQPTIGGFALN